MPLNVWAGLTEKLNVGVCWHGVSMECGVGLQKQQEPGSCCTCMCQDSPAQTTHTGCGPARPHLARAESAVTMMMSNLLLMLVRSPLLWRTKTKHLQSCGRAPAAPVRLPATIGAASQATSCLPSMQLFVGLSAGSGGRPQAGVSQLGQMNASQLSSLWLQSVNAIVREYICRM